MMRLASLLVVLLLAGVAVPASMAWGTGAPTSSQANSCQENASFRCCGDMQLLFRNPDLNPSGPDDPVTAQGALFAQFQAIGPTADKIAYMGFSFSPIAVAMEEDQVCEQEPWAPSGPYIINYRADTDASDGYFINLQTTLVPDGDYMAAVHAYDASDNEIARGWVLAEVDNCDGAPPARCDAETYPTAEHIRQDKTMPWPIMLPGDGEFDPSKNNAPDGATLTLEFAEPLAALKVYVNGVVIHEKGALDNMTAFDGREWDDDLIPGYGPYGLGPAVAGECTQQPPQECGFLGEAWAWNGRALTDVDVVRVEATDLAGNLAKKEIHIGSGQGGAITSDLPVLQMTVDELTKTVSQGEAAIFRVEMTNTGGSTAHPFTNQDLEAVDKQTMQPAAGDWDINWLPHKPVAPGAKEYQELTVRPGLGAVPGIYQVNGTISWPEGVQQKDRSWQFTVNFGGVAPGTGGAGQGVEEGEVKQKDSPVPIAVPLAGLAVGALLRRMRKAA